MNRIVRGIVSYVVYPVCFTAAGLAVIHFGVKPVLKTMDAEVCMQLINGAPDETMDYELSQSVLSSLTEQIEAEQIQQTEEDDSQKQTIVSEPTIEYGTQYGSISCEEADFEAPLYYGDDDELLRLGAGQYVNSSLPGTAGTCIIGGHDSTFFASLEQIALEDEVVITTNYGEFTYEVTQMKVAKADDESAYDLQSDIEQVILYTCYPFGVTAYDREDRYYVYCSRKEK